MYVCHYFVWYLWPIHFLWTIAQGLTVTLTDLENLWVNQSWTKLIAKSMLCWKSTYIIKLINYARYCSVQKDPFFKRLLSLLCISVQLNIGGRLINFLIHRSTPACCCNHNRSVQVHLQVIDGLLFCHLERGIPNASSFLRVPIAGRSAQMTY